VAEVDARRRVWNSLPLTVTSLQSLPVFKRQLKTAPFARRYKMPHTFAPRSRLLILLITVRCPSSRSTLRHL